MINYTRPEPEEVWDQKTEEIIGDPQFLLDFAIIGFGKCGTSSMMHWLASHPEVRAFREEVWELMFSRPEKLVQMLYFELPEGHYKRGYKVSRNSHWMVVDANWTPSHDSRLSD